MTPSPSAPDVVAQVIAEMQMASDAADEANGTSEYTARLIALALIARHFLRTRGESSLGRAPAPLNSDGVITIAPEPQDTYRWGEPMPQFAVLGIGPEALADLTEVERKAHERRITDRSFVSLKWGTFRLVMTVLRAIRLRHFREESAARTPQEPAERP